jgi:oligopeptide/dipeptide ABC transporter ATP-binding protein
MTGPLLEVAGLSTHFKTRRGTVVAVNDVSFSLEVGETLGVVGESGCGKSVTALSIMRLINDPPGRIASGSIRFEGRDLLSLSEEEMQQVRGARIAMIFQDPMTSLNPVLTIGTQMAEMLELHTELRGEAALKRAAELLEMVGIPAARSRLDDYPHHFSGGMRQRVMIAMALSCTPNLLIADEPTTALDVTIQAQIVELVARLREQMSMAIIWITHDLGVVAGLADRVMVMYAGYIVEEASVFDVYENPHHPYTLALLGALPRVDKRRDHRLKSIPGAPPNLLVEPRGCPFSPRCEYSFDHCSAENPLLRLVEKDHRIACWVNVDTGARI